MMGASALEDLVSRLAWSLLIRLQSKGIITSDEVAGELESAVTNVDGLRGSAFHEEISSCLREMLTLLREQPRAAAALPKLAWSAKPASQTPAAFSSMRSARKVPSGW
ncbi:MAG TPA: hypothetical protein VF213_11630 [Dongiaceae bacterium]|jgi:hypothetical protein